MTPRDGCRILVAGLVLAAGASVFAIVGRHDREDAAYLAFGEGRPETMGVGRAHGTLIDRRWVITAAHVASGLSPISGTVRVLDRDVPVDRVVLHPSWRGDLGPGRAEPDWIDLALLHLAVPVEDVAPATLYDARDEVGTTIVFAGRGGAGDGRSGPVRQDGRMRAATNVVARADDDWLYFDFDTPPAGTDLEGISGPGDSGNAAILERDGRRFVLGVGSRNAYADRGLAECTYGTTEVYARVSSHLPWIRSVLAGEDARGTAIDLREHAWPAGPASSFARTFLAAYAAGDAGRLAELAGERLDPTSLAGSTPEAWGRYWSSHRERAGAPTARYVVPIRSNDIVVLAVFPDRWRSFRFLLRASEPHAVLDVKCVRETELHGRPLPAPASQQGGSTP